MSHGGNIYAIGARLGMEPERVRDFSASINPLGMPKAMRSIINANMGGIAHYPDPDSSTLSDAVSARFGIGADCVLCANGSTELIYLIPRALKPARALIASPTFSEYERASVLSGARVTHLELRSQDDFLPDPDKFASMMRHADMAFFCNPGNPSGVALDRDRMLWLIKAARRNDCLFVLDEAFMDFCPDCSVLPGSNPNLIVLRSLTKFYALAGLRVGFGVMPKRLADKLKACKEPWSVNVLAERLGAACLRDIDFSDRTLRFMSSQKSALEKGFRALGIKFYPSCVNYYLLETEMAAAIKRGLLSRAIAVRDCSDMRGLGDKHIRVAVRTKSENRMLLDEIARILKGGAA